jgi:seryl-tRNA(Sec) selenium transferase
MTEGTSYETDFHAWAIHNAELLRQGRLSDIDLEHIADELESMGASERRELLSRLQVLVLHLLKYELQPDRRSKSWPLTINHQRTAIERLLEQSPSLARMLDDDNLGKVYRKAVRDALIETDLERHVFPADCPYAIAEILDEDWLPSS